MLVHYPPGHTCTCTYLYILHEASHVPVCTCMIRMYSLNMSSYVLTIFTIFILHVYTPVLTYLHHCTLRPISQHFPVQFFLPQSHTVDRFHRGKTNQGDDRHISTIPRQHLMQYIHMQVLPVACSIMYYYCTCMQIIFQ